MELVNDISKQAALRGEHTIIHVRNKFPFRGTDGLIYNDAYYSCRTDNIAVRYRDILMRNNNVAEAKSAMNCFSEYSILEIIQNG